MTGKINVWPALFIAGLLTFLAFSGSGSADRKSTEYGQWARQAEDTFYLSPGMGEKVLSQKQWTGFQTKMKEMAPEQLSAFRMEMHKALMREARDKEVEIHGNWKALDADFQVSTPRLVPVAAVAGKGAKGRKGPGPGTSDFRPSNPNRDRGLGPNNGLSAG